MSINWEANQLKEQLVHYQIKVVSTLDSLFDYTSKTIENSRLVLKLDEVDAYAAYWGEDAGIWVILAVIKMLTEILDDYPDTKLVFLIPDTFGIQTLEDNQQDIGHRCLTAYQEIYDVLVRTHQKPSSPIWHRRAFTFSFPQLILEVSPTGTEYIDPDEDKLE